MKIQTSLLFLLLGAVFSTGNANRNRKHVQAAKGKITIKPGRTITDNVPCNEGLKVLIMQGLKNGHMEKIPAALGLRWEVTDCKVANQEAKAVDENNHVISTFLLNKADFTIEGNGKKCALRTEKNLNSKSKAFRNIQELTSMLENCAKELGGASGYSLVKSPTSFIKCDASSQASDIVKKVAANLAAKVGLGTKSEDFEIKACDIFSQNKNADTVINVELETKDGEMILVSQKSSNGKLELRTFPESFVTEEKMKYLQPTMPQVSAIEAQECGPTESDEAIRVMLAQIPNPAFKETDYTLEKCQFIQQEEGRVIIADLVDREQTPLSIKAFTPSFSTISSVEFTPAEYVITASKIDGISKKDREEAEESVKEAAPKLAKRIRETAKWVQGTEEACQALAIQFAKELGSEDAIADYDVKDCFTKENGKYQARFTLQGADETDLVKVIAHRGVEENSSPFTALPLDWVISAKSKFTPGFSDSCSDAQLLLIANSAERVLGHKASLSSVVFTENIKTCYATSTQLTTVLSFDRYECSANFALDAGKITGVFGNCVMITKLI